MELTKRELELFEDAIKSNLPEYKIAKGRDCASKIFLLPIKTCTKCNREFEIIKVNKI